VDGRRLVILAAAVVAGLVLLVLARPDGQPEPDPPPGPAAAPDHAHPPAPAPVPAGSAPAVDPSRTGDPERSGSPSPAPVPEVDDGGVVGGETLAADQRQAALRAAERFAQAWASPEPDWHGRLAGLATPELADALAAADPPRPVPELTGTGQLYSYDGPQWARIGVPASRGTLVLDVISVAGQWLVSAVDWWPA
jgi:hypothetical protein